MRCIASDDLQMPVILEFPKSLCEIPVVAVLERVLRLCEFPIIMECGFMKFGLETRALDLFIG